MIRLLIVDDDVLIRESLKIILDNYDTIEVIGAVEHGKAALELLVSEEVDVILLDMRMPVMDGIQLLQYLKQKELIPKRLKVLVLTTFDEDELIQKAVMYGANGYLLKNSTPDKIAHAIYTVADGHHVFHSERVTSLGEKVHREKVEIEGLSKREMDIVREIAQGLSNKEIAESLYISEGTVKNYITSILSKMDLKHRTQIAVEYLKQKYD